MELSAPTGAAVRYLIRDRDTRSSWPWQGALGWMKLVKLVIHFTARRVASSRAVAGPALPGVVRRSRGRGSRKTRPAWTGCTGLPGWPARPFRARNGRGRPRIAPGGRPRTSADKFRWATRILAVKWITNLVNTPVRQPVWLACPRTG